MLPDLDGAIDLSPSRSGPSATGARASAADGVLRVVRSENDPESEEFAAEAPFFMDYRNADGIDRRNVRQRDSGLLQYLLRVRAR